MDQLENVLSEKGWSQADLSRRSGLSGHTIGRAVRDKAPLSERSAEKIARALRVGVQSLRTTLTLEEESAHDNQNVDPRRIKAAMVSKGMNPTELATKTGLSVATISSAIRGSRRPNKRTVEKIAEVVGDDVTRQQTLPSEGEPKTVELRATAGQIGTVRYPAPECKRVSEKGQAVATELHHTAQPEYLVGPAEETISSDMNSPANDLRHERGTIEELYSHVRQTRQMLSTLLEHVTAIETHLNQVAASSAEGRNGTGRTA